MRSFIVAAIILTLIVITVVINSLYVTAKIEMLTDICDNLPKNNSAESVEELITEWQSCRDIIALSVHRVELERAENAVFALKSYRESKSEFEYHLSVLNSALHTISDNQKFSLNGIV